MKLYNSDGTPYVRVVGKYDADEVSDATGLECLDESLTDQSQKEETDINVLFQRMIEGVAEQDKRVPRYADYSEVGDYQTALNAVRAAGEEFMALDAKIRARFNHDPQQFLEFCADDKNVPEMRKLGLMIPEDEPAPPAPVPPA